MKILKTADEEYRMTVTPAEARIFINCMNETIRQIPTREYQTRMGATLANIKSTIAALEAALR